MNGKKARELRRIVKAFPFLIEGDGEFEKTNVKVKAVPLGRMVFNDKGVAKNEELPAVTFTQSHVEGTYRPLYRKLKKHFMNGEMDSG